MQTHVSQPSNSQSSVFVDPAHRSPTSNLRSKIQYTHKVVRVLQCRWPLSSHAGEPRYVHISSAPVVVLSIMLTRAGRVFPNDRGSAGCSATDVTDDCRVVRFVPCHCLDMVIGRTAPHNPPMSSEADLQPSSFAKVACVCGGADESTNREDEA